jgi:hypothetical protein
MKETFFAVCILVAGVCCTLDGAVIYVPDQFALIQNAIAGASQGDTIVVRPGTYRENLVVGGKGIVLRSEKGPAVTILDGGDAGNVVTFTGGAPGAARLDGFTVTNGYTHYVGGGIFCDGASPEIVNNLIAANRTSLKGAGVFCDNGAAPLIEHNLFRDNRADKNGGGICSLASYPVIVNNRFEGNKAGSVTGGGGGGVCSDSAGSPWIEGNVFRANEANDGGAVACYSSSPWIAGNLMAGNSAGEGGGIYCGQASPMIVNNIIIHNDTNAGGATEVKEGGGIHCRSFASPMIVNNTIAGNRCDNHGGGIFCWLYSSPLVVNTILWNNSAPIGPEIWVGDSTTVSSLAIHHSLVDGGLASVFVDAGCTLDWGVAMIDADPLPVDRSVGDWHLTWDSPCRDGGDTASVGPEVVGDVEHDPRVAGASVDIGADEFFSHLYHLGRVRPGGRVRIGVIGEPGAAPVFVAQGAGLADPPWPTPHGDFYLDPPILNCLHFNAIPANGVLTFHCTLPSSWNPGDEYPFQALIGAWGAPSTTLTNPMILKP